VIDIRLVAIAVGDDPAALVDALAPHIGGGDADRAAVLDGFETLARVPREPPWDTFVAYAGAVPVGVCAFNGMPADGAVEIGYYSFPAARQRGVATAMAAALVEIAWRNGMAQVFAHTLPTENASSRALARCGFTLAGTAQDPEEGLVWRWELPLAAERPLALSGQLGL
jgi:RimJ/RimL family protein N-acetyltransferase